MTTGHDFRGTRFFHVSYKVIDCRYVVDTEAKIGAVPATRLERSGTPLYYLQAVNSTSITVYKERSITLDPCLRLTFRQSFPGGKYKSATDWR